jgi:hypothetical protein
MVSSETADLQLGIFFISLTDGSNQSCVGIFQPTAVERHKLMDFMQNCLSWDKLATRKRNGY